MSEDPGLHAYFAGFGEGITALAREYGVNVDLPNLDSRVTAELLGLPASLPTAQKGSTRRWPPS